MAITLKVNFWKTSYEGLAIKQLEILVFEKSYFFIQIFKTNKNSAAFIWRNPSASRANQHTADAQKRLRTRTAHWQSSLPCRAPPADSTRTPILLVPHSSRERIWAHCRSTFEDLLVLSPSEVPLGVRLKVLGNVSPESIGRLKPEPEDSPETLSEFWQRKPRWTAAIPCGFSVSGTGLV